MAAYTFFGIQVAVASPEEDDLPARLRGVILAGEARQTLADKRTFWRRVSTAVNASMPAFTVGHWDLIREDRAEAEFDSWCREIEREGEGGGGATAGYLLVTLAILLERGSNSDLLVGERCDLPESAWFTRTTFARLVGSIPSLNFANVQSDAVYVVPGGGGRLTDADLRGEGYEYLRPLA